MDIDNLRTGFTYVLLERVNPEKNENRFYYLAWQQSLFAEGAIVRSYGRRDGHHRMLTPLPYPSFDDAWPLILKILRLRLRHGYRLVEPKLNIKEGDLAAL